MSNSSPSGQRPPNLRDDEPIALLIAALSFGAIFFWILNQNQEVFSVGNFLKKAGETKAPQIITTPLIQPTEAEIEVKKDPPLEDSAQQPSPSSGIVTTPAVPSASSPSPTPSIAPSVNLTPAKPGTPLSFTDVPKAYWAYPFITALSAQGIIGGFPDGTFKPEQPVSRVDFATQVQKAYTKPDKLSAIAFTDLPPGDRRLTAVEQAVKMDFMSGYPDKTFRPTQQVSRLEAAIAMARGLNLPIPSDPEAILQTYADQDQIPSWARSRMAASIQAGLFAGDPDTKQLNPNRPASRADIVVLVFRGQKLGTQGQVIEK
ncbi:S-layer homology domain-containing protein [Phormidium sp. CLA17]|uniref:S-layer homology domain-containing protein n=1 Tax=Leptolyngbya sp. Cla-17 TaxID=2803751 RepID=UPI0014916A6F|nr:S-layer homology domain-containing protein [Leptolyngbya sp. Cla-17]MBM0743861.1 S-layer homology domain-containing protein [Leptolyngbya sp. Cla-17]